MFDFIDFVLDVDELEVGFVFVVLFGVLVASFLGLRFLDNGIHFLVFGFLGLRKWL